VATILIISSIVKRLFWWASPLAGGRFYSGGAGSPAPPPRTTGAGAQNTAHPLGAYDLTSLVRPDFHVCCFKQWCRQDLLLWGAKLEISSWGTHGGLQAGCSSCPMTNSFVTNAVLIERAASYWHLHQLISQTTQYLDSWLSDFLQSELKMKLLEVTFPSAP